MHGLHIHYMHNKIAFTSRLSRRVEKINKFDTDTNKKPNIKLKQNERKRTYQMLQIYLD